MRMNRRSSLVLSLSVAALFTGGCGSGLNPTISGGTESPSVSVPDISLSSKLLSLGETHGCRISESSAHAGKLKCWGEPGSMGGDMLGSGLGVTLGNEGSDMGDNLSPVNLGTGLTAKVVRSGRFSTCAILSNNKVKCWGANSWGNLGTGNSNHYGHSGSTIGDNIPYVELGTGLTPVDLAVGENFACAHFSDGRVKCWGNSSLGQQASGNTNSSGSSSGSMGDNRPFLNLGTGRTVLQLSVRSATACAVLDDHTLKCWGLNAGANLGVGHSNNIGDDPSETGDGIPNMNLGSGAKVRNVQVGNSFVCAHLFTNQVKCWGLNDRGQLGTEGTSDVGTQLSEMGDALPVVNLGTGKTVRQLASGSNHSCVILSDNTVKCWGLNAWGQLGIGDTTNRGRSAGDMGDSLPTVDLGAGFVPASLSIGAAYSCALSTDKRVKCWGQNAYGQLGLGDTTHRGGSSSSMGDNLPVLNLGAGF